MNRTKKLEHLTLESLSSPVNHLSGWKGFPDTNALVNFAKVSVISLERLATDECSGLFCLVSVAKRPKRLEPSVLKCQTYQGGKYTKFFIDGSKSFIRFSRCRSFDVSHSESARHFSPESP
jgi:hypothetical protein